MKHHSKWLVGTWAFGWSLVAACSLQIPDEADLFAGGLGSSGNTTGGLDGGAGSAAGGRGGTSPVISAGGGQRLPIGAGGATGRGGTSGGGGASGDPRGNAMARGGAPAAGGVAGASSGGRPTGQSEAGTQSFDAEFGLVARFAFDDMGGSVASNANDPTKNGTYFGGCTHPAGHFGTAVAIRNAASGSTTPPPPATDWIGLPDGLLSSLSATTISIWVRDMSTTRKGGRLLDFSLGESESLYFAPDQTDSETSTTGAHLAGTHAGSTFVDLWSTASVLTDKVWHFIAWTWSAEGVVLYIDGRVAASQEAPGVAPSDLGETSPNWLGRTQNDAFLGLYAEMDDLRIYDRALTASEIAELYAM